MISASARSGKSSPNSQAITPPSDAPPTIARSISSASSNPRRSAAKSGDRPVPRRRGATPRPAPVEGDDPIELREVRNLGHHPGDMVVPLQHQRRPLAGLLVVDLDPVGAVVRGMGPHPPSPSPARRGGDSYLDWAICSNDSLPEVENGPTTPATVTPSPRGRGGWGVRSPTAQTTPPSFEASPVRRRARGSRAPGVGR